MFNLTEEERVKVAGAAKKSFIGGMLKRLIEEGKKGPFKTKGIKARLEGSHGILPGKAAREKLLNMIRESAKDKVKTASVIDDVIQAASGVVIDAFPHATSDLLNAVHGAGKAQADLMVNNIISAGKVGLIGTAGLGSIIAANKIRAMVAARRRVQGVNNVAKGLGAAAGLGTSVALGEMVADKVRERRIA